MSLSEEELRALLRDLESDRVERKESAADRDKLSQAICAFANDLRNLGPTLRDWRSEWRERLTRRPVDDRVLPTGTMQPLGNVVFAHGVRLDRPVKAYQRWMDAIPRQFHQLVLDEPDPAPLIEDDQYCLATVEALPQPDADGAGSPQAGLRAQTRRRRLRWPCPSRIPSVRRLPGTR